MAGAQRMVTKVKLMEGEHTKRKRETLPERGSAIKGNSVGGTFALPTAPTARLTTVRLMLAWAAYQDWEIQQIDIKSAYLYGELNSDEEIYIRPPPGKLINIQPGQVLKLKKALYGLKQAG